MNPDFYRLVIVEARGWVPGVQYTILPAVCLNFPQKAKNTTL